MPILALLVVSTLAQSSVPLPGQPRRAFSPRLEFQDYELTLDGLWDLRGTSGSDILLLVLEGRVPADLNGDGDRWDRVLHGIDLATGEVTNYGLEVASVGMDPSQSGHAAVVVREAHQGNQDLNGDGDKLDSVLFGIDLVDGEVTNSARATSGGTLQDGWVAFAVNELGQGDGDLNGDGRIGNALFAWDLAHGGVPASAGGLEPSPVITAHEALFLFPVDERRDNVDRNGDGDALDWSVIHSYAAGTGALASTGVDASLSASGRHSALFVSESAQAADLNGDGDQSDTVLHVFDLAGNQLQNLGLALGFPVAPQGHGTDVAARQIALSDEALAFHVSEPAQGDGDLNGDGDATDRDVLFVHLLATGETRNLGLSVWNFELQDGLLAMQVQPTSAGDAQARVHHLARNTTWDLGVRTPTWFVDPSSFVIHGNWVALIALEDGVDRTGDGDGLDRHVVLADARRNQLFLTGLACPESLGLRGLVFHDSGVVTALAAETDMARDLNGDLDTFDRVVQLVFPEHGIVLNSGATSSFLARGHRASFPFLAHEADDGVDHNGDGDVQDTVLRSVRVRQH